jgi:hypothetical protein
VRKKIFLGDFFPISLPSLLQLTPTLPIFSFQHRPRYIESLLEKAEKRKREEEISKERR